jgi:hypothetical protein
MDAFFIVFFILMSIIKTYKTTYYIPNRSICPNLLEERGLLILKQECLEII